MGRCWGSRHGSHRHHPCCSPQLLRASTGVGSDETHRVIPVREGPYEAVSTAEYELHYFGQVGAVPSCAGDRSVRGRSPRRTGWLATQRPRQEIHAYLPITFSSTHLCVLDCTVHSCLTDVRFKAPAPAAPVPEPSRKLFGGLTLTPGRQRARSSPAPVGRADGTPAPADADGEHDVGVLRATSMPRSPTFHETADGHKAIVDPTARSLRGYLFGASAEAVTDRQVRIVS